MWGYPGAQNKFTAIVSVRGHVDANRICLRPDGANSECSRGLFGVTKVGRSLEVASHPEALPVSGDDFSCSAQLAASSLALQPLFCQKTGH
jgi:hypothetical protein